ncbi:MAG: TolC family protein [Bdellovibrio sp.]
MKKENNFYTKSLKYVFIMAALIGFGSSVLAQTSANAPYERQAAPLVLTPANLKDFVLSGNLSLAQAYARVQQAEDRLNKARMDLLPSINVGAVLSGPNGLGAQAMSTLPFLLPSNWYRLSTNKDLREAEALGFKSLTMNTILTAEKNYFALIKDSEVVEILVAHRKRLIDLGLRYENRNLKEGKIDPVGMNLINGKSFSLASAVQKTQELVAVEKSAINRMLARRDDFTVLQTHTLATPYDSMTDRQLWDHLVTKVPPGPEMLQLQWLIKASKNTKWSQIFSFLGSAGMNSPVNNGNFGQLSSSGTVNLGFGMIPVFSLGNHQIQEFQLQQKELIEEGWRIVQSTSATLQSAKQQVDILEQALFDYEELYRLTVARMERGEADLMSPFGALQMILDTKLQLSEARLSLDQARLQIKRLMREDFFKDVQVNLAKP